jgi:hypothetical protein
MFRIYTEDKNRRKVKAILNNLFQGYTLIPSIGAWEGHNEKALVIELDGVPRAKVMQAAKEIKTANSQQAVLIQRIRAEGVLI